VELVLRRQCPCSHTSLGPKQAVDASVSESEVISEVGRDYLRLQVADGVGPIRLGRLVRHLGSARAVLEATPQTLQCVDGVGPAVAESILATQRDPGLAEREIELAARVGARVLCLEDPDYPASLKNIPDPPICLFVRGTLLPTDAVGMAVVGSRRCSRYGQEQAERFGGLLSNAGFTVVSGLARGIDGFAHRGALAGSGRTIAVLGNGLAQPTYPPEHRDLAEQIVERGALVAEVPLSVAPDSKNFPARNRIIAGLALGVLVVEAGPRSGALISARLACEYNREVFAIPGRVDYPATSGGTNGLIQRGGAKLVTCLEDILEELGDVGSIMARVSESDAGAATAVPDAGAEDAAAGAGSSLGTAATREVSDGDTLFSPPRAGGEGAGVGRAAAATASLSEVESAVYRALDARPLEVDALLQRTRLTYTRIAPALTTLQLKGLVTQLPGPRYVRRGSHVER
jgi:DNA processing protein